MYVCVQVENGYDILVLGIHGCGGPQFVITVYCMCE